VGNLSRLAELLGSARTREILFTSRLITADEALRIGLINECVADPLERAHELCSVLRQQAPLTLAASKEGLRRLRVHAAGVEGDDLIVECYTSDDFREGMQAFLAKRKPVWLGH
jgi:enoyl-CoA hydratase/carnithine racemase